MTNNNREFSELLKGCRPVKDGNNNIIVQSIMNMQIVCLTTDNEYSLDNRFGNPFTALKASNQSYGHIGFANEDDREVIIPNQMAVMTKQKAQNHGMTKAGYIDKRSRTNYTDAGCVQGSQTGTFTNTQEFRMLPLGMREMSFETVGQPSSHSRLYLAINKLGNETRVSTDNYLDKYFNKYDKKLEQFIAHFEKPKRLIGIIILVDDEIIAVDKFPSFTYAEQVWKFMIRDCYGSIAIMSELNNKTSMNEFTKSYEEIKRTHRHNIIELLENAMTITKERITKNVEEKIQELLDISFETTLDTVGQPTSNNSPKSYILKNEGYIGQVITENEYNHMVSIVKKDRFDPNAFRQVNELKRKARKQEKFTL